MVSTRYQEPTFDSSIDAQNKSVRILKKKKGKKKRTFSSFLESRGFLEFCFGPSVAQKAIERARVVVGLPLSLSLSSLLCRKNQIRPT